MPTDDLVQWFPLSQAQRSRWFQYCLDPASRGRHNNVFAIRLHGKIDESIWHEALLSLVELHPMLRARFSDQSGEPLQRIEKSAQVSWQVVDASGLSQVELERTVAVEALRPFNAEGSPVRVTVYRCKSEASKVLVLALDHLVSDGWSYWQLVSEWGAVVAGTGRRETSVASYADYVSWQRHWLEGAEAQLQLTYWKDALPPPFADFAPVFCRACAGFGVQIGSCKSDVAAKPSAKLLGQRWETPDDIVY